MEKSNSITNLTKALIQFDAAVNTIKKGETNPFFKNKYASLPDILESIKEPLQKAGLTVKQFPENGCQLTTIIFHAESGEYISSTYEMKAVKDDPQQQGSRITYQRRYALGAVLGLNIDVDDDANSATHKASTENNLPTEQINERHDQKTQPEKPWLGEKPFKQALEKINVGEEGVLNKLKEIYKIKKDYFSQLQNAENEYKNSLNKKPENYTQAPPPDDDLPF